MRKFILIFVLLIIYPALNAFSQTNKGTISSSIDTSKFPQWTKDLRRWEIVAFGSFPFTMFTATFAMDTYRFAGTGWTDYRYAPWPLKSAGAVDMTNKEYETTMIIAAGMSCVIAVADLIIVNIKRHKERQRIESMPVGTAIIIKRPWPPVSGELGGVPDSASDNTENETPSGVTGDLEVPPDLLNAPDTSQR